MGLPRAGFRIHAATGAQRPDSCPCTVVTAVDRCSPTALHRSRRSGLVTPAPASPRMGIACGPALAGCHGHRGSAAYIGCVTARCRLNSRRRRTRSTMPVVVEHWIFTRTAGRSAFSQYKQRRSILSLKQSATQHTRIRPARLGHRLAVETPPINQCIDAHGQFATRTPPGFGRTRQAHISIIRRLAPTSFLRNTRCGRRSRKDRRGRNRTPCRGFRQFRSS